MQKVMILGCCGAGKSTLAQQMATILHLPLLHLDAHFWKSGWVESESEDWKQSVAALLKQETWVMDGNYSGTLDLRLPHADTIVFLDLPHWLCLWRIGKRWWQYRGVTRPDMAANCPEHLNWPFLKYVWNFPRKKRPKILQRLQHLPDTQQLIVLRSPAEVKAYVRSLEETAPGHRRELNHHGAAGGVISNPTRSLGP